MNPQDTIIIGGSPLDPEALSPPIALVEGVNPTVVLEVTSEAGGRRTYTIVVTRLGVEDFAQRAYVKASNTGFGDQFGYSVAAYGDTVAVGALDEDSGSDDGGNLTDDSVEDSGAVYVFTRVNGTWRQQDFVKSPNIQRCAKFGSKLALWGDTLAVAAERQGDVSFCGEPDEADGRLIGAVYVFTRIGDEWFSQGPPVEASNRERDDRFGVSVALWGRTMVVGAAGEDSSGTGVNEGGEGDNSASAAGAVYVFERNGILWEQKAYVKASNTSACDQFGKSVALWDDTLVVGAYLEDGDGVSDGPPDGCDPNTDVNSGAAYVYVRSDGEWVHEAYLKASNSGPGDNFGWSVAAYDDTVVVGAPYEDGADDMLSDSGAVYVFTRKSSTWQQEAYVKACNADGSDHFGWSVALSEDLLAVGAPQEDGGFGGVDSGRKDDTSFRLRKKTKQQGLDSFMMPRSVKFV